jgi:transposase InsO family protein
MQECWQHQFQKDVWRNNIPKIWIGVPKIVISDGGSHFIDKRFEQYLSRHGIRHNVTTPYHPQTSG